MPIAVASLGSIGDTNTRSVYTCSIFQAPEANALILVGVVNTAAAGTVLGVSSVSGAGMEFSLVTSGISFGAANGSETHHISLWRSMAASTISSVISVSSPVVASGCAIVVDQVSGVNTSGTSGSGALSVNSTTDDAAGAASAVTLIAASATSTADAWYSLGGVVSTGADTPGLTYTLLQSAGYATPSATVESAWTALSTGTTSSWAAASQRRGAIMVGLVAADPVIASSSGAGWTREAVSSHRAFPPRLRNEFWVEIGHSTSTFPELDTREN